MSSKRPFSRAEKSVFVISGVGILLLAGLGYFNLSRNAIPVVEFPPPAKLPVPNGFDLYIAAANAITKANPAVDGINDLKERTPAEKAQMYSLEKKSAWLKANAKGFALFDQGMKTPTVFPNPWSSKSPPLGKLRDLARFKIIEVNNFKLRKQPVKAVESALDCIQMGVDVSQNANMIGTLAGTAVQHIGMMALEDENRTIDGLNASEAKAATRRLESLIARNPAYLMAVEQERWLILSSTLGVLQDPKLSWRNMFFETPSWRERLNFQFRSARSVIEGVNADFDKAEALLKTPYNPAKWKSLPGTASKNYVTLPLSSMVSQSQFSEVRRDLSLKFLLTRLALRAYHVEKGTYPAKLAQLVSQYLEKIPTDGFAAGKPLSYRLKGASYELWSVGPDGKNDNGKPAQGKRSRTSQLMMVLPDSLGDWVAGQNR